METEKQPTFILQNGIDEKHFIKCVVLSSISDDTPEGKSIIELAKINPSSLKMEKS